MKIKEDLYHMHNCYSNFRFEAERIDTFTVSTEPLLLFYRKFSYTNLKVLLPDGTLIKLRNHPIADSVYSDVIGCRHFNNFLPFTNEVLVPIKIFDSRKEADIEQDINEEFKTEIMFHCNPFSIPFYETKNSVKKLEYSPGILIVEATE